MVHGPRLIAGPIAFVRAGDARPGYRYPRTQRPGRRVYSAGRAWRIERGDALPVSALALPGTAVWRPQDPADVVARARPCVMGGGSVLVPTAEDLGEVLALHGVKHGWTSLLWVADFVAAVSRPGFSWGLFVSRGDGWGVGRALRYALLVGAELAALEMPADVLAAARTTVRLPARGVGPADARARRARNWRRINAALRLAEA
jgi:hypothetical protein